jgi:endonuclease/exonuclease/phosphatase family metal-dependent hydrolase
MLRNLVALTVVLAAVLLLLILWMAGGAQAPRGFEADVERIADVDAGIGVDAADSRTLRVLVWNVAWGYGFGSDGSGQAKPAEHFARSVQRMAALVRASDADVVLLQEIDFDATRSHHVDQAEAIARAAGLPYVARAVSWKANWVPFPYWPPSEHFGRMRSGGAILSRYPLSAHDVELFAKPDSNPLYYNLFYLFRYAQQVRIDTPVGELFVVNVHLEAFDADNRMAQARRLAARLGAKITPLTILGGDFNSPPPETEAKSGFADEPQTDFTGDDTVAVLRQIEGLTDAFAPADYRASPATYFTFPASAPNRKLDHALVGSGFIVREARVYREADDVSDHLPLLITLEVAGD